MACPRRARGLVGVGATVDESQDRLEHERRATQDFPSLPGGTLVEAMGCDSLVRSREC